MKMMIERIVSRMIFFNRRDDNDGIANDDFINGRYEPGPAIRPRRIKRRPPVHDYFPDLH